MPIPRERSGERRKRVKFFIPHLKEASDPEKVFESICRFGETRMGWLMARKLRPYMIEYKQGEDIATVQVGRDLESGELITAILASTTGFLACNYRDGFMKGIPLIIDREDVVHIEYFEEYTPLVSRNLGSTY